MLKYFIFLFTLLGFQSAIAQMDIADARALAEGTVVTVRGIATNGGEQGIIRYLYRKRNACRSYRSSKNFSGTIRN